VNGQRSQPAQHSASEAGAQQHGDWEEDLVQSLVFQRSVQERIMHILSIPALFAQLQHRLPRLKICRPTAGARVCVREFVRRCMRASVREHKPGCWPRPFRRTQSPGSTA
jgi:hypothetical protein